MIRTADFSDIDQILRLSRDFVACSETGLPFDPVYLSQSITGHLSDPSCLSLVLDLDGVLRGMFFAVAVRSPLSPVLLATELAFWIDPSARGRWAFRFLRQYEGWARGLGCQRVAVAGLQNNNVSRLYRRAGYVPAEQHFMKVL